MDRKIELSIIVSVIAIMLVVGIIAIVIVNTSAVGEIGYEEEHEQEHEHEHEDGAMVHFVEHISNWMIWVFFAMALLVGIIIFYYFKKH